MRRQSLSEKLRYERRRALKTLDDLERPTPPPPAKPTTHLHEDPRRRPTPLPEKTQATANEIIAQRGTGPDVIDSIMAAQFREDPLTPRRWSVDSHLPRRNESAERED